LLIVNLDQVQNILYGLGYMLILLWNTSITNDKSTEKIFKLANSVQSLGIPEIF